MTVIAVDSVESKRALLATLKAAYEQAAFVKITYVKDPSDVVEEIDGIELRKTVRNVLPLTPPYMGRATRFHEGNGEMYVTTYDGFSQGEIDAEMRKPATTRSKYVHKMHPRRTFLLRKIEAFDDTIRPLRPNYAHFEEVCAIYPQLRKKLGVEEVKEKVDRGEGKKPSTQYHYVMDIDES